MLNTRTLSFVASVALMVWGLALPSIFVHAEPNYDLSFDYFFQGEKQGEILVRVDEAGRVIAVDNAPILEKIPALLQKMGISDHPLLSQKWPFAFINIETIQKKYALILRVDSENFKVDFFLREDYTAVNNISISPQTGEKSNSVPPATVTGWLQMNGAVSKTGEQNFSHTLNLYGNVSIKDYRLLFSSTLPFKENRFIDTWRFERNIWKERNFQQLQLGWLNPSTVIGGQLIPSRVLGGLISNSLNSLSFGNLLQEVPGGIIAISEPSTLDIFSEGLMLKSISVAPGRYRIRDLFLSSGIHQVDIRITSQDGRVQMRSFSLESFPLQPLEGDMNYSLFAGAYEGTQGLKAAFSASVYRGFGGGLAAGLHSTFLQDDGLRLGFFTERYFSNTRLDIGAYWQDLKTDYIKAHSEIFLNISHRLLTSQLFIYANLFKENAPGASAVIDASIVLSPRLLDISLGAMTLGYQYHHDTRNSFYLRYGYNWNIHRNLSLQFNLNYNSYNNNTQGIISLLMSPLSNTQMVFSHSEGTTRSTNAYFSAQLDKQNSNINAQYARLPDTKREDMRLGGTWNAGLAQFTATALNSSAFDRSHNSNSLFFSYQSTLLFADGSFALSSDPPGPFVIVDGRNLEQNHRLKVLYNNRSIRGMIGRHGISNLMPYLPQEITIDPSDISLNYNLQTEHFYPTPNQAFRILLVPNTKLIATGTLLLPNREALKDSFGTLRHQASGKIIEWFSSSTGEFACESEPGTLEGEIEFKGQLYTLSLRINEKDSVDGLIFLGNISLTSTPLRAQTHGDF